MHTLQIQSRTKYPLAQEQRIRILQELGDHGVLPIVVKLVATLPNSDIARWDVVMELYVRLIDNVTPDFSGFDN